MTAMFVCCDYEDFTGRCLVEFERNVTLPVQQDAEVNRVAAIINLAVAEGWQAVNTPEPRTALTYCPLHHRADVHVPCCSMHGHALTCEAYRRTHFVEVRPCCGNDVAKAVRDQGEAREHVSGVVRGDRLTLNMPREPNTAYAPSAAEGLIDSMTTLRLPDNTVRPVRVVDAVVLEGNLQVTIEVEPGVLDATDPRYLSIASDGEAHLGYYSIREKVPDSPAGLVRLDEHDRVECPECGRMIGVYQRGDTALIRNHNRRGTSTRCSGSKREPA